jgi:serine/threonine protein kinase
VGGEPLDRALARMGRLEPAVALSVLTLVAAGLEAIAKQNLVHRDIKPGNIMISWEDQKIVNAKIIDLGLAKGPPLDEDALRRSRYKEFFWAHPLTPVRNNLPDSAPIFVPIFIHSVSRSGRCFRVNCHFKVLCRN